MSNVCLLMSFALGLAIRGVSVQWMRALMCKVLLQTLYRVAAMQMLSTLMGGAFYSLVVEGDLVGSFGPIAFTAMSVWVIGWTMAAVKSQAFFFTVGALIGIFVSTLSPGKPNSEDSKLSRPFMGRQASWLSELSTSTTAGGKRD